jgi:hypothetical protein
MASTLVFAQATKSSIDGVRNFTVVDATVGCAGATEAAAIPALAARGYKAIVNLRLTTEAGAAIDAFSSPDTRWNVTAPRSSCSAPGPRRPWAPGASTR